eukprot:GCRY01000702.1.p1 GENE.GCRY01000702.1~~GCRY01000702.1.p1  ORF type:complete len:333 (+),score=61.86 GCRY01000702.1:217-1215(+)
MAKLVLFCILLCCVSSFAQHLDRHLIDTRTQTLSGISSGGFFAVQYHLAHSSTILGAAIIAGGPYYCANNDVALATGNCMKYPDLISVDELIVSTENAAVSSQIDSPKHLADSKVWLFSGTKDTVVHPGVVKKLEHYYRHFLRNESALVTVFDIPAEHAFVNDHWGNKCDFLGAPYINNCKPFDSAASFLPHLLSNEINPRIGAPNDNLKLFDQLPYLQGPFSANEIGMAEQGYVYIPTNCQNKTAVCHLHVSFHGCHQSIDEAGDDYPRHSGINQWAEANNIIVLYPQATKNVLNPKGCWDWWGYSGVTYPFKEGYQISSVKAMVEAIGGQ